MPSSEYFYQEYPCSYNAPLNCDRPFQTAQELKGAKFCLECGFPATLPQNAEIKGNLGTYQVTSFLGARGNGRLYSGIQLKDQQPVIIKEYLLPNRCFNQKQILERKEAFKRVGGVTLVDSRIKNFRLVDTWEAIADEKGDRCYLIIKKIEASQTLHQYLSQKGPMTAPQVREVLNQALQTLEFLHSQKLRFPSNQIQQGLPHGNLSLDSILIKLENNQQFYIYFCDLAIWENTFIPPNIAQPAPCKREQDLEALGLVAFYLWVGKSNDSFNQPLDPRDNQHWPNTDNYLKQFISRLVRLENPFVSAEVARQTLLQMPKECQASSFSQLVTPEETENDFPKALILLGILALILVTGGIWHYFWQHHQPEDNNKYIIWSGLVRNFFEVNNFPTGKFTYTGESAGTWSFILKQQVDGNRLEDLLTKPKPEVKTTFNYEPIVSSNIQNSIQIIQDRTNQKDFAITSLVDNITDKLDKQKVAYDGLLVFLAFSKKDSNLVNALGGQITLEQLRQIYTGKITNWQQINPKLKNSLDIRPFAPSDPEAIRKFQEIVLKNDPQDIALFKGKVENFDTTKTQNLIRKEILEKRTSGIIGFGIISKTWGQCTGYPLAIVDGNKPASQPLFQRREHRPITTSDDLCQHNEYFFDVNSFQSYPLGYPIFVVYPKDNNRRLPGSTFAEILTTRQGQCLLSKVGLVPLQPIPDDINSYACKSVP
ncbi:MAG: substrate-binding domain-containing protein [Mojavia pulchra JT2-VF2]|jgi:ABC-type phosphate transport system substrate-binding protein|uniref:Substrate-binding domain-containing protein n=1 Tax=Mojavia pulchra JT2-VF2 TaxID=287848 RepID=A0A951Q315_9NOST|nr:substrate-binding domain-containing protein [Mojavia pulchra JT2-VF2]